jgi:hypothetical protein
MLRDRVDQIEDKGSAARAEARDGGGAHSGDE